MAPVLLRTFCNGGVWHRELLMELGLALWQEVVRRLQLEAQCLDGEDSLKYSILALRCSKLLMHIEVDLSPIYLEHPKN